MICSDNKQAAGKPPYIKDRDMKAKLLNPLQENMRYAVRRSIELVRSESENQYLRLIQDWIAELVVGYALTVASGNDTYLKGNKSVFDEHIERLCCDKEICRDISIALGKMIELLNA